VRGKTVAGIAAEPKSTFELFRQSETIFYDSPHFSQCFSSLISVTGQTLGLGKTFSRTTPTRSATSPGSVSLGLPNGKHIFLFYISSQITFCVSFLNGICSC
jgi:hypothetical protein